MNKKYLGGFTLIELMVTLSIIGVLSAVLFANFEDARKLARDKTRMASLKEMQLSLEIYKSQNGSYPVTGCSSTGFAGPGTGASGLTLCVNYVPGLAPDFIPALPSDPMFEADTGKGFYYKSDGSSYKLMILNSVESNLITSFGDEFARCPAVVSGGGCATVAAMERTYAVYSAGAQTW